MKDPHPRSGPARGNDPSDLSANPYQSPNSDLTEPSLSREDGGWPRDAAMEHTLRALALAQGWTAVAFLIGLPLCLGGWLPSAALTAMGVIAVIRAALGFMLWNLHRAGRWLLLFLEIGWLVSACYGVARVLGANSPVILGGLLCGVESLVVVRVLLGFRAYRVTSPRYRKLSPQAFPLAWEDGFAKFVLWTLLRLTGGLGALILESSLPR